MQIIDGKKIRAEILERIKKEIALLPFQPVFCDILVGEDPTSAQYVKMKAKTAEALGIKFQNAFFPSTISTEELILEIKKLNTMPNMCGLIIQLPLPESIDRRAVLDAVDSRIDVDFLGTKSSEEFYKGETKLGPPTALACLALLDSLNLDLKSKKIVVLGQGELVGRPVSALLSFRGLISDAVTRKTENKEELLKNADVIISGIGHGKHITGEMVKDKVILIDAGTSEASNVIVGDVDLESVSGKASFVSPVPGGVGPVTVAMLMQNVLEVAKQKQNE